MASIDACIQRLRAFIDETGMAPSTLARRAGLSKNALAGLYREGWSPHTRTLRKALGYLESAQNPMEAHHG